MALRERQMDREKERERGRERGNQFVRKIVHTKVMPALGATSFHLSTKEMETVVTWLDRERNIRWEGM